MTCDVALCNINLDCSGTILGVKANYVLKLIDGSVTDYFDEALGLEATFDLTTMGYIEVGLPGEIHGSVGFQVRTSGGYSGRLITDASRLGLFNLSAWTLASWWKSTDYPAIQYFFARYGGVAGGCDG